jgi:hypothetical protein
MIHVTKFVVADGDESEIGTREKRKMRRVLWL